MGLVTVELKALIKLGDVHLAQALNYLEAFKIQVGLLINFGGRSLEFKRVLNNKVFPAGVSRCYAQGALVCFFDRFSKEMLS
jgi:hypothetical protein